MGQTATVYGRELKDGDEFEVPEKEALVWKLLGKAVEVTVELPQPEPEVMPKRKYNRRDLQAEE